MVLEEYDLAARGHLITTERRMTALRLDNALVSLENAYDAVYLLCFLGEITCSTVELTKGKYPRIIDRIKTVDLEDSLDLFHLTCEDIPRLHSEVPHFFQESGYTYEGLRSDKQSLVRYGNLIKYARDGCFLEVKELEDCLKRNETSNGLPRPLISDEAVSAVWNYAREHGEDGLEYWLKKTEDAVYSGYTLPIESSARVRIGSYVDALGVPFPEASFQHIVGVNARNIALNTIRVLQSVKRKVFGSLDDDKVRECLGEIAIEGEEYARQAGLGLVYKFKLSRARKQAEKRLLSV